MNTGPDSQLFIIILRLDLSGLFITSTGTVILSRVEGTDSTGTLILSRVEGADSTGTLIISRVEGTDR